MSIPAGIQEIRTVQTAVSIRELRSVPVCAPGSGKENGDKAAFRRLHQLGIHWGISHFHRKESESHESDAIHLYKDI